MPSSTPRAGGAGTSATGIVARFAWDAPLLGAVAAHLLLAPYTKVEESFNMQASHDILALGTELSSYDHQQFPGAVPRTFLGALATAAVASPSAVLGSSPLIRLYAVRLAVALCSVAAHARLRSSVASAWGETEARCLAVIAALQFHLPFYMSRTLPNTFALVLACAAHAELVGGSGYRALAILGAAAAMFRCDLLVLIAPLGLILLAQGRVRFFVAAIATAAAAAGGAAVSVAVDSAMWGRLLWPELEVLWFNTGENKSSEWGTSPPLWYFYSALPRALLGAVPLAVLGALLERRARGPAVIGITYVGLYSFLPHKELRFLFPALPLLNVTAAAGAARCLRMKGTLGAPLARLAVVGLAAASLLVTGVMAAASAANYPGGVALAGLHTAEPAEPPLRVHIGNLAATTGVSRFLEAHSAWNYSKEEHLQPAELYGRGFDRLLAEWPEVPGFTCQAAVLGFERIALETRAGLRLSIRKSPKVYVLARSPDGATAPCGEDAPQWG